jgi:hypothetical protein
MSYQLENDEDRQVDNKRLNRFANSGESVPIKFMNEGVTFVGLELFAQAGAIHPGLIQVLEKFYPTSENPSKEEVERRHKLGIDNMAAVYSLMVGPIDEEIYADFVPLLAKYNVYFMWEKISDDFAYYDWTRKVFPHKEQIARFNGVMQRLFDYKDRDTLALEARRLISEIKTEDISTETRELIQEKFKKFPREYWSEIEKQAGLPKDFIANPETWFLTLNAYAGAELYHSLQEIAEKHPELRKLIDHALRGLRNRYGAMDAILEDPTMPIRSALKNGKFSILTDVFAGICGIVAAIAKEQEKTEIYQGIVNGQKEIIRGVNLHTELIRYLNDGGFVVESPGFAINDLERVRNEIDPEKVLLPRELFIELENRYQLKKEQLKNEILELMPHDHEVLAMVDGEGIDTTNFYHIQRVVSDFIRKNEALSLDLIDEPDEDSEKLIFMRAMSHPIAKTFEEFFTIQLRHNTFARLIKDAVEAEYNTILDSESGIEDPWEQLYYNASYAAMEYQERMKRFLEIEHTVKAIAPVAHAFLYRFVYFNLEMYNLGGADYDRLVKWNTLRSMTAPDITYSEVLNPAEIVAA